MSSSQIKHIPAEIIVLDSDDHDVPVVHAKQKAHAESSNSRSDVGVVETEGMSSSSSGKRFQCCNVHTARILTWVLVVTHWLC
jgi:hypothetical protein